ncbi:MAG: hypothetical protein NZ737_00265, partial [Candidatus Poseidoniaceae archaeon]|nr:hypothetical protein [Candidatus Poseidoniaceae archaeon]
SRLRNSLRFHDTRGRWAFMISIGLRACSFFRALSALLPYDLVKAIGSGAHLTGITSTPS